jgi:hypothetical protein
MIKPKPCMTKQPYVKTISQTNMKINTFDFWGSNYYSHPALTEDMINLAEKSLNVKLPDLLVDLLNIQNGGYTRGYAFPMNKKTTWAENHVPLLELFGIITDENILTGQNLLDSQCLADEWGLPEKQILLAGDDGHWWITLDYRKGNIPSVRWIDIRCDEDMHIADSFEDFMNGLVSVDEFVDE